MNDINNMSIDELLILNTMLASKLEKTFDSCSNEEGLYKHLKAIVDYTVAVDCAPPVYYSLKVKNALQKLTGAYHKVLKDYEVIKMVNGE